ncbi:hypothetical protein EJB05_52663, partial [Eragrostis curvula]
VYLLVVDYLNYWIHRLLHTKWAYNNIHHVHHDFTAPTGYAASYSHWVEVASHPWPSHFCLSSHCALSRYRSLDLVLQFMSCKPLKHTAGTVSSRTWSVVIYDLFALGLPGLAACPFPAEQYCFRDPRGTQASDVESDVAAFGLLWFQL